MEKVNANQAAKLLGISVDKLEILEKQGIIHSTVNTEGVSSYSAEEIAQIKSRRSPTLAQEAEQVAIGIQREIVSSVKAHRKVLLAAGGVLSGYALLVALFTALFFIYPLQTSDFLGYYYRFNAVKPQPSTSMINGGGSVLAAETGPVVAPGEPSVLAYILKPVAAVALVPVKAVDNQKFLQVVTPPTAGAAGLSGQAGSPGSNGANGTNGTDGTPGLTGLQGIAGASGANGTNGSNGTNGANGTSVADVLTTPGSLIIRNATNTTVPLTAGSNGQVLTISGGIPAWENSSTTTINFSGLLAGDVTGTQGATVLKNTGTAGTYGSALNIPVFVTDAQGRVTSVTNTAISGLTTSNFGSANISQWTNNSGYITTSSTDTLTNKSLSGSTNTLSNIPNSALTNSALTVSAGTGLATGGTVSLGGTVTLSLPNVGTSGTYGNATTIPVITTDAQGRVSGVTATGISGLTASNLTAGDFSSKINSGTYSINITGSAGSATNFSGSLLGDVTGTQGSTTVAKINGAVLGTTTATSGNLLIGSGTQWVTQALSNDATINSSGALTLKNTGTAGTYGSSSNIPVFVTDAQGRVTGVTNTTISGLTVSNFTSPNISQWTNNSGYITASSIDTLTNKTISAGSNTISGLTNSNLSGSAGITNANLANSSLTLAGNSGSGSVALGGTLTLTGAGITNITASGSTLTISSTEADTLSSVTGRGATTATALTLSSLSNAITAGTLTVTGGTINGTTIGATSPSTGVFTTINGLTIANNGTNTLTIAAGKTLTVNNSITFGGTDGTTFTLPTASDTLVGRTSTDTFTNKTIAAGSNTISGLTNSNLSGSAGITNANLANSSITTAGNSGGGSVSLGGGLTFTGAGITNVVASGSTLTVTSTEADTLQSVFNRGNSIPTTTGSTANTIDQATIAVGNIASTAQQNFSTLNITNGGTGYLDVELLKGFINFQGMNTLYDDFTGNTLDTNSKWTVASTGSGSSCQLLAGGLNGLLRMTAGGAANRRCELSTQSTLTNGYYQRGNNPIFEAKLKIDVTTNVRIFAGFTNTAPTAGNDTNASTHHAYIEKLAAGTKFQCVTDNGGATETVTDTGVTVAAATFYRLRVEVRNGTTPETICTIDDGTTVTRTVVTATQPGATNAMDIYEKVETSNSTAKNMDVDYVRVWQDDPSPGLRIDNNSQQSSVEGVEGSVNVASIDATSSASPILEEKVASSSATIVDLVISSISNIFNNLVEFFGNVIFHADVSFLGRATFNSDTGGFAVINAGALEVVVNFDKEYQNIPIVIGSPDTAVLYSITDVSTKGFKIKLTQVEKHDIKFSWTATAVKDAKTSVGTAPTPTPKAGTPIPTEIPTVSPTPSPSMIPTDIPSVTPSSTASPSAGSLP